jgi:hypothetical protein
MSNSSAIAAVTATLHAILSNAFSIDPNPALAGTQITFLPLDQARKSGFKTNQVNLYLYQVLPNAAWRNMNIPTTAKSGETGMTPLALDLHYLVTAFGPEDESTQPYDHQVLGKTMSVLFDHALLGPTEIAAALAGTGLENQADRVRITLQPLSLDDISKLWMGFATQYRVSVGYDVSVVLIDSTQTTTTPLPVLTRGPNNQGWMANASILSPLPGLTTVTPPNHQDSARLGDTLVLTGFNLNGTNIALQFDHPLLAAPIQVAPLAGSTATTISVTIPNAPAVWPAGFYTVEVLVQRPGETFQRTTNQLSFSLAPTATVTPSPTVAAANITYTATCSPELLTGQSVFLLLGNQEIPADTFTGPTATVTFEAANMATGTYFYRLRVDGVDSILVNRTVKPPVFDTTQQVVIT